ncbi:hypothetical protein K1T71_000353 [Dendrolimus kikuchii]|uniref:Uncharacterized protein n=1 Tax=Dendrolimus kikuchii TaxID=765133 RepID=A0ACC1DJ55_9NEOP|nr:hypothetical protein K1T71_000353 [Dendrolimus kikuchii]
MADWSLIGREWPPNQYEPYQQPYPAYEPYYEEKDMQHVAQPLPPQAQLYPPPPSPMLSTLLASPPQAMSQSTMQYMNPIIPRGDNPREIRNKAEKQRRDKLNQSIAELASMVPTVVAAKRKIDKTGILRLTAHYLRAHKYVFGETVGQTRNNFSSGSAQQLLGFLKGFLLTITYRGLVVVVSQNVHEYIGYTEIDLLGQNIINIIHEDDRHMLKTQLIPNSQILGPNGELLIPDGPDGQEKIAEALAREKRQFIVRFKKLSQRTEPCKYVTCHVEGSFRKSDKACKGYTKCCQMIRRVRARGDNPCSSGNDVVFIGVVRLATETFITESKMEAFKMEYRTRHSVDGEIIQCEPRISLVTGYMTHEVFGVNAMNFMHRDDVRWVVIALREMYDQHRLYGESCYRLMTKNGQIVYMRTRGRLEVDEGSRAVTSFVCTNTLVGEQEGKELIKLMKKKFSMLINNNDTNDTFDEYEEESNNKLPVEDPKQLEKVILHLVTNLPSPHSDDSANASSDPQSSLRLNIIPPRKEKIVSAIEKIYSVIKTLPKEGEGKAKNENAITCVDITQDKMSPGPSLSSQSNENVSEEIETNLISNENVFENSEKSQNELVPFNNVYKTLQPNYIYEDKINYLQPDEDVYPPGTTATDFVTQPNLPRELPEMTSIMFTNATINSEANIIQVPNVKYDFLITPETNSNKTNIYQDVNVDSFVLEQLTADQFKIGVKRTSDGMDQELNAIFKKKTPVLKQANTIVEGDQITSGSNSPSLEKFFDEAILNTQIESAINSLEQTIDPNFPDLLVMAFVYSKMQEEKKELQYALQINLEVLLQ